MGFSIIQSRWNCWTYGHFLYYNHVIPIGIFKEFLFFYFLIVTNMHFFHSNNEAILKISIQLSSYFYKYQIYSIVFFILQSNSTAWSLFSIYTSSNNFVFVCLNFAISISFIKSTISGNAFS